MTMIRNTNTTCVKHSASLEIYHQSLNFVKKTQKSLKEAKFRTLHRYMILCVTPVLINNLKHKETFFATGKNIWCDTQFKLKVSSKIVEN